MRIKRRTLVLWKKRLVWSLGGMLVCSVFYVYFRTSLFSITSYELVGVPEMYKDTIETSLFSLASQKSYKIFPSNRVLTYRAEAIKAALVEVLPNTQTVTLLPIGLHTLRVKVVPYEPFFKIDNTHAITQEGVIYTEFKDMSALPEISFASSSLRQEMKKDGIGYTVIAGIDYTKLNTISTLINKINSVIFKVSKIDIDEFGDISLYDASGKGRITFAGQTDIDKVWSNILSAIDTEPLKSKLENNKDHLEYLDARFGNKVFYKFTNTSKTAIIQSHATTTATTTLSR